MAFATQSADVELLVLIIVSLPAAIVSLPAAIVSLPAARVSLPDGIVSLLDCGDMGVLLALSAGSCFGNHASAAVTPAPYQHIVSHRMHTASKI